MPSSQMEELRCKVANTGNPSKALLAILLILLFENFILSILLAISGCVMKGLSMLVIPVFSKLIAM